MRKRTGERGSLLTTLFVITFIVIVAFSLTVMSFQHWTFSQYAHNRVAVRDLAENAAQLTVAHLIDNPTFGTLPSPSPSPGASPIDPTVTVTDPDNPDTNAVVTFNPVRAAALGMPCSTNNQSETAVDGYQMRIPRETAQIIARTTWHGVRYDLEVVMHTPPYPMAIVSTGSITSHGPLLISGLKNGHDFTAAVTALPPEKLLRASMASNLDGDNAISLDAGAEVNGNVQACGRIHLAPDDVVRGAVMQEAPPVPIPALSMDRYLQAAGSGARPYWTMPQPTVCMTDLTVEWMKKCNGPLSVYGDVILDGGTLVVTGDLYVSGAVKGSGAILCGGGVTVARGANFQADDVVAVLARGPITLTGQDRTTSCLQGLVYSETSFTATRLTILGCVLVQAPVGQGQVNLHECSVIGSALPVRMRLGLPADTNADDDESIFTATCYPDPADPHGRRLLWDVSVISYSDSLHPNQQYQGGGKGLTRAQAEALILDLDARAPHPGATGHTISSATDSRTGRPCVETMRAYFDRLEQDATDSNDMINVDLNKLLKPAVKARILLWRPLSND